MASLKEVRARISSINSTQQITKAMKMVAAAKLRRAQDNITQLRPYAQKLGQMLSTVSAGAETAQESPYKHVRSIDRVLLIVVTSDRGLCGAFNTNAIKAALSLIEEKYASQARSGNVEIMAIGKKGAEAFQRRGFKVNTTYVDTFGSLSFANVRLAAEEAMAGFVSGSYDVVELVYNEFKNAAVQIVQTEQMLPIVSASSTPVNQAAASSAMNYIFEPSEEEIITELIPKTLKIQLYKAVLDSNAAEHGARMTAMDKATDNAGELLKALRLVYNRTRSGGHHNRDSRNCRWCRSPGQCSLIILERQLKTTISLMVVFLFYLHHSLSQPRIELQKSGKPASLVARYTASEKLLKMINLVLNR